MEWGLGGFDPVILNNHQVRPGMRRGRLATDHVDRHSQMYYHIDGNGLMVPAGPAGGGRMRAASASAYHRPAQIVIKNEFENHSPQRSPQRRHRHSSHGHDYRYEDYSDDSFDDRALSPHRQRSHNRRRSRRRRSPSRSPSPYEPYDFEKEKIKAELEELKQREHAKEEEHRARERAEEEILLEEARKVKKKKDEEAFKKKAIEEHNIKMLEEQAKKAEEKKKQDEEYEKRARKDLEKAGFDEEEIMKILKGKMKAHEHEHEHAHGHHGHDIHQIVKLDRPDRPTYIRVRRKHLSTETLDIYELPWDFDERDPEYIIIKRWIPEHDQYVLFEHSRRLRERKLIEKAENTVELEKRNHQLFLVKPKSKSRSRSRPRSWMFT